MRSASLPKIESPAAFFRDTLKKGYAAPYAASFAALGHTGPAVTPEGEGDEVLSQEKKPSPPIKKSRNDLVADWVRALAKEAEAVYRALDDG